MGRLLKFTENFFWTMVWVIVVLIAAFAVLAFVQQKGGSGFLGNLAGKIGYYAKGEEVS